MGQKFQGIKGKISHVFLNVIFPLKVAYYREKQLYNGIRIYIYICQLNIYIIIVYILKLNIDNLYYKKKYLY